MGLDTNCQAGCELCEVSGGCDRHPDIQPVAAVLRQHTQLYDVEHMVQAHDHGERIDRAAGQGTDTEADCHQ